jgi:hypothetical protein
LVGEAGIANFCRTRRTPDNWGWKSVKLIKGIVMEKTYLNNKVIDVARYNISKIVFLFNFLMRGASDFNNQRG